MEKDYSNVKKIMLVLGIVLIIVSITFFILGFTSFPSAEDEPDVIGDTHEEFSEKMDISAEKSGRAITYLAIGGFTLIPGLFLIYISQFRKVVSYVATEASPGLTTASRAIGSGLKESGAMGSNAPKEVIKVKCPHCGYLDSEDAEYCSKCGKKI